MSKIADAISRYIEMGEAVYETSLWQYFSRMSEDAVSACQAQAREMIKADAIAGQKFKALSGGQRTTILKLFAASIDRRSARPSVQTEEPVDVWAERARSRLRERQRTRKPWPI